ncbi:hypothetical protein Moror_5415 [Moniliophthora roreri MCA 2997]|uniref:Uncharacterized protein n=2 Tax=Moniliophthora roreri TaxID=221103 RepID=V2WPF6_MONRO|nr:hypothetical protein Moror_5415 [Moniliophthora roreri MCA 2997]
MELPLLSQQAEEAAQANAYQFLDLEAAVDRERYNSENDKDTDGFINNNNNVGRPINYQALNRVLDTDNHNLLFLDLDLLFSEPQDESAGDDSIAVGGSGLVVDQGSTGVDGSALKFDKEDPNIKRYRLQEVWSVKCKPYHKQDIINFITQDGPHAASILHGCMYTCYTQTGSINGVHMTVLSDSLNILHVLSMTSSIAKAITSRVEKCQPDPKKPVLKAGVWVRLGLIEKPKKELNSKKEASGPPRKKTRLNNPSTQQVLTEENMPIGNMDDIYQQTEPEASGKPTRGQSYNSELLKPRKLLYYDDPALVLKVDGHAVTVLFIPRIRAINMPQSQLMKEEFPHHPAVSSNFPLIKDWRFNISKMVIAPTGQQGVVISHSPAGPTIQCYKPLPNNCDPDLQDLLTMQVGIHCSGWKLIKSWLLSDFVHHVSGIKGFVIILNSFNNNIVLIKHLDNNIDYNFSGHTNSFRLTPQYKKSQEYSIRCDPKSFHQTLWMEAAVQGPHEITTGQDWQQFQSEWKEKLALRRLPQQVFVMDHIEALAKIKKA